MKNPNLMPEFDFIYTTNPELQARIQRLDDVVHSAKEVYDLYAATAQYIQEEYLESGYIIHARNWFSVEVDEGIYRNQCQANQLLAEIIGLQEQAGLKPFGLPFHYHPYLEQDERPGMVPQPGQTLSHEVYSGRLLRVGLFDYSRQSFMSDAVIADRKEAILLNHQLVTFL